MKKIFLFICLFLLISSLTPVLANAAGLVPCGDDVNKNGKLDENEKCKIESFFEMLGNIFNFIVKFIATPLAVLMLTIGGIMILISAGNPNLAGTGKKILWVSVIGLVLVFGSWLIISFILGALGYTRAWNVL